MEKEEFIKLINQNRLKLYKTAMAILKNDENVNDAIQETLLSAYKNIDKLESKEYFLTWIITILRNKCFDILKRNKKIISIDESEIQSKETYYDTYKVESSLERILKKIDELVCLIKDTPNYKRYNELKNQMKNNKEIMSLIKQIKKLEQSIIKKEYNKLNTKEEEKKLKELKEELKSFPIYLEYSYLQEDLNNDFQNIKKIIEDSINN